MCKAIQEQLCQKFGNKLFQPLFSKRPNDNNLLIGGRLRQGSSVPGTNMLGIVAGHGHDAQICSCK